MPPCFRRLLPHSNVGLSGTRFNYLWQSTSFTLASLRAWPASVGDILLSLPPLLCPACLKKKHVTKETGSF